MTCGFFRFEGLVIRDSESRHGTFVDGKRIGGSGALARHGSIVRFGDTLFLSSDDVDFYATLPRRLAGESMGLTHDMLAGPALAQVWDEAARVADLHIPVLIVGESGSGKECVARIFHRSATPDGPFVAINVAAIPENLFEAEFFGYERGAFTGAASARKGAFREASGGVLFLDEIGTLAAPLQAKLLRAIELQCVRPLGASQDVPVKIQVIAATSANLHEACRIGSFRKDLYYRLAGVVLNVPPLRERRSDIVLLASTMLLEKSVSMRFSSNAVEALLLARWDGNARNLRYALTHAIGRAAQNGSPTIDVKHLPDMNGLTDEEEAAEPDAITGAALTESRIRAAMHESGGVAAQAAESLGISRTTLYNALKRFGIDALSLRAEAKLRRGRS